MVRHSLNYFIPESKVIPIVDETALPTPVLPVNGEGERSGSTLTKVIITTPLRHVARI
jgi:hypothetical protein